MELLQFYQGGGVVAEQGHMPPTMESPDLQVAWLRYIAGHWQPVENGAHVRPGEALELRVAGIGQRGQQALFSVYQSYQSDAHVIYSERAGRNLFSEYGTIDFSAPFGPEGATLIGVVQESGEQTVAAQVVIDSGAPTPEPTPQEPGVGERARDFARGIGSLVGDIPGSAAAELGKGLGGGIKSFAIPAIGIGLVAVAVLVAFSFAKSR